MTVPGATIRPDWFHEPECEPIKRPNHSIWSANSRMHVARVVEALEAGEFALPPWQRAAVWTEAQRVKLLDSIIRDVSIGAITLWMPTASEAIEPRPFDGLPVAGYPSLVVDGQQRLTTLAMAARGDLDRWRWNGREWTTGPGFLLPSDAVRRHPRDWLGLITELGPVVGRRCIRDWSAVVEHEVTFMALDGSTSEMLTTYERLATCGSPHSLEDLAVMERWLAEARS